MTFYRYLPGLRLPVFSVILIAAAAGSAFSQTAETARMEQVAGTAILTCVFAADGTIQHVLVLQSLTHGLTEASIAATKRIKFVPALVNGKPVSTFMQLEYNFNLF